MFRGSGGIADFMHSVAEVKIQKRRYICKEGFSAQMPTSRI